MKLSALAVTLAATASTLHSHALADFAARTTIREDIGLRSLRPADLDGDGDPDLLWAEGGAARVAWVPNLGGGLFGAEIAIDTQLDGASDALPADLDGDGDLDVVCVGRSAERVCWHENLGGGTFGPSILIDANAGRPVRVRAGDLDGDGDLDLVVADRLGRVVAYPNSGTAGFGGARVLASSSGFVRRVELGDLDGDGDLDVLYGGEVDFGWIENLGGPFAPPVPLTAPGSDIERVELRDVDQDSDLDICFMVTFNSSLFVIENLGGGGFTSWRLLAGSVDHDCRWAFVDVDRDGTRDLVSNGDWHRLDWRPGLGGFEFGETEPFQADDLLEFLTPVDLDGDGIEDLLGYDIGQGGTFEARSVVWLPNRGDGLFESAFSTPVPTGDASALDTADIDQDGDLDVAYAEDDLGTLYWASNDGAGGFGAPTPVDPQRVQVDALEFADVDGDGDQDLVTVSWQDRTIVLYTNQGVGQFAAPQVLDASFGYRRLEVGDLDGDGDVDLVAGTWSDSVVTYFENLGAGIFAAPRVIGLVTPVGDLDLADLDADGDLDIVMAGVFQAPIAWIENLGGGQFSSLVAIDTTLVNPRFVAVGDLDGDALVDLVTSNQVGDDGLVWLRGLGGGAFAAPAYFVRTGAEAFGGELMDMDGDGDLDLAVSRFGLNGLSVFENLGGADLVHDQVVDWDNYVHSAWTVADVDADGLRDIVTVDPRVDALRVYLNTAEEWTNFCSSTPNSLGVAALLSASGSTRVSDANFALQAAPVPNQPGIFFHGANPASRTFGTGFLCASGGVARGSVVVASGQQASYSYDNSGPLRTLAPFVGGMRYFQYWYRDPLGASGFDTTDGLRIYVLP